MKSRYFLGLMVLVFGLVFGLAALPATTHAANAVQLSATDRSNLQAVLDLTKTTLDAIQVQINHNAVQDPAAMIVTLNGIKGYLLTLRELVGGTPVTATPSVSVTTRPSTVATDGTVLGQTSENPAADTAMNDGSATQDEQASSSNKRWILWIVLAAMIIFAIVLLSRNGKKIEPVTEVTVQSSSMPKDPTTPAVATSTGEAPNIQSA